MFTTTTLTTHASASSCVTLLVLGSLGAFTAWAYNRAQEQRERRLVEERFKEQYESWVRMSKERTGGY